MKQIDLKEWVLFGAGGNGKTYRPADEANDKVLLKVNKGKLSSYETVKSEYDSSNAVRSVGVETPEMYEIVQVGKNYGVLFERIKGAKGREIHALECNNPYFSPVKDALRDFVARQGFQKSSILALLLSKRVKSFIKESI